MLFGVSPKNVYYILIYIPECDANYSTNQKSHFRKLTHLIYPPCYLYYQSHLSSSALLSFLCVFLFYFSETLQTEKNVINLALSALREKRIKYLLLTTKRLP